MQLAVPKLRTSSGLLKFNEALKAADYDLAVWRERTNLPAKETALLDADDSAGWDLAEALLRPRKIEVNEDSGTVKFVNTNKQAARLGVSQALDHRFMQQVRWECACRLGINDLQLHTNQGRPEMLCRPNPNKDA